MANVATVQEVHRIQDLQQQRPKIDCNLNQLEKNFSTFTSSAMILAFVGTRPPGSQSSTIELKLFRTLDPSLKQLTWRMISATWDSVWFPCSRMKAASNRPHPHRKHDSLSISECWMSSQVSKHCRFNML